MSNVLLGVLNETLNGLAKQQKEAQEEVERIRETLHQAETVVRGIEEKHTRAAYEEDRIAREVSALSVYLRSLKKHPSALLDTMNRLTQERHQAEQVRCEASDNVESARAELRGLQSQLGVAQQRVAHLRQQWNEVSEHVAPAQRVA